MLLFIFLLFPYSLAAISIHETNETGLLEPIVRTPHQFQRNAIVYTEYNNWKTGENMDVPNWRIGCSNPVSAQFNHICDGFFWRPIYRDYDGFPSEEPIGCAYYDHNSPLDYYDEVPIGFGKSVKFENGTVEVRCSQFEGRFIRSSESFTGCYFNETVYRVNEKWVEPNPKGNDTDLKRLMKCERSEDGYFVNKLVGCSISHNYIDFKTGTIRENQEHIPLNGSEYYRWTNRRTCVETEPGVVGMLRSVDENIKPGCLVSNVFHHVHGSWEDKEKAATFICAAYGRWEKQYCTPDEKHELYPDQEVKLKNGCTFLCHPQTNIFKCDKPLEMFKVVGKPRKMRKLKDSLFGKSYIYD